jgi:DNA-binding CsgD family transcriptional regulator
VSGYAKRRAQSRIADLAYRGLDVATFYREAGEAVASAVPGRDELHFWHTLDPASLLVTSSTMGQRDELPREVLEWEYLQDDHVKKIVDTVRSDRGHVSLHEATGGDPDSSPYLSRVMQDLELDYMMQVALRARTGQAWGCVALMRGRGQPDFDRDEIEFLESVAPVLADGVRRGLLVGEATDPERPEAPGIVVLDSSWEVHSATPGVERWLAEVPGTWDQDGKLPAAVVAVAARALRGTERSTTAGEEAMARVRSRSGRWILLHGAALVADGARRAAVIIEPAHPARITALLMDAYGLTKREQEVTRRALCGDSTNTIARTLFVSPHTVQQHLKSIFDKTRVRSRRELVGKVFFSHYEPRVRDNEQRVVDDRAIRGGPWTAS